MICSLAVLSLSQQDSLFVFLTCTEHSWLNLVMSGLHVHDRCLVSLRLQACSPGSVEFLCLVFTSPFLTTYPFSSCTLRSHHTCLYNAPSIPIIRPNVADTCWHLSTEGAVEKRCVSEAAIRLGSRKA